MTEKVNYPERFLDLYKIDGCVNIDTEPFFEREECYPNFKEDLVEFKNLLIQLVENNESKTFYKFGDGDYCFLKKVPSGSATPGRRALSKSYDEINHQAFVDGAKQCDYYTCEIYTHNRQFFREVIPNQQIHFPAEYGYGLVANKWLMRTFAGKIGLIGANTKMNLIQNLMEAPQYQEYLGIEKFENYISLPQKYACDNLEETEMMVGEQLKNSSSKIFLIGIGHVKSGLIHRLKKYTDAVFLDVGSAIDALAGIIDVGRPYFGDWTNYQIDENDLYDQVDYLGYERKGKHVLLGRIK
jgi:hypothetical protein